VEPLEEFDFEAKYYEEPAMKRTQFPDQELDNNESHRVEAKLLL